jgi:hypothetical protein
MRSTSSLVIPPQNGPKKLVYLENCLEEAVKSGNSFFIYVEMVRH